MNRLMDVFGKLAFLLMVTWIILAGLGMTEMPGSKKEQVRKRSYRRAKGDVWQQPLVTAPGADDGLAFPAAFVM